MIGLLSSAVITTIHSFEYLNTKDRPSGFTVDLIRAVARDMNMDVSIQLGRWEERVKALRDGRIDAMGGMFYSAERDRVLDFGRGIWWPTASVRFDKGKDLLPRLWKNWPDGIWLYRPKMPYSIMPASPPLNTRRTLCVPSPKVGMPEVTITNTKTQEIIYHNSFITDIPVDQSNVEQIIQAGRSRWKVENEKNNVLKTKGYHLEHNFGHGKQFLSSTLLNLNLLAFLSHIFLEFTDEIYWAVREEL